MERRRKKKKWKQLRKMHQKKQKRWLKMLLLQRKSQRTQPPDANELQEKFDALVEENGKLKADLATLMAEK
jgi:hypothetical protein